MEQTIKKYNNKTFSFDPNWGGKGAWRELTAKGKLRLPAKKELQDRWGNPNEQGMFSPTQELPKTPVTPAKEKESNVGKLKKNVEQSSGLSLRSYKSFVSDPKESLGSATMKYVKQQFTPEIIAKNLFGDLAGVLTAKALNVSKERMTAVKGGYNESIIDRKSKIEPTISGLEKTKKSKKGDDKPTLEKIESGIIKSNMHLKRIDDYFLGLKSSGAIEESLRELKKIREKLYGENTIAVKFSKSSESRKDLNTVADYFDEKGKKEDIAENFAENIQNKQTSFLEKISNSLNELKNTVSTGTEKGGITPAAADSDFSGNIPDVTVLPGGGKGEDKKPPKTPPKATTTTPSKFGKFFSRLGVGAAVTGGAALAGAGAATAITPPTPAANRPLTAPGETTTAAAPQKTAKINRLSGNIIKGLGPIAAIISLAAVTSSIQSAKANAEQRIEAGEPENEVEKDFKKQIAGILAGEVGGVTGGVIGAIAGQMAIPIPVVGGLIGGVAGGLAGGMAGTEIGERLYDFLSEGGVMPSQEEIREKYERKRETEKRTQYESRANLPGFDEYGAQTVSPNLPMREQKKDEERYLKEREEAKRLIENYRNLISGADAFKEAKKRARESARTSNLPDTTVGMDDMSRDFTKYPVTGKAETEPTTAAEKVPQNFTAKQKLLEQIAAGEGTSEEQAQKRGYKSGYDVTLGYGKFDPKDANKPITEMTLDELDAFQTEMLKNPENKLNSSAVGKYQIVRTTLRGLKEKLGLKGDEKFTPELQDKLASELLQQRGMGKFEKGEITQEQFQENLAKEWASIATKDGKSFYGQRVGTTSEEINRTIAGLKTDKAKDEKRTLASSNVTRRDQFEPTAASSLSFTGFERAVNVPSDITIPQRTTGAAIESRAQELSMNREAATATPPVIAPNTTNITNVNNNTGGGGRVIASIRNEDPTFIKMQMTSSLYQVS